MRDLASRAEHSWFWNIAYFDEPYFKGIFEDFVFPDGTEPQWESVLWLQKRFMNWFNKERLRRILTFPVETVNLLDNGKEYVDKDFSDFVAEMWSKGHSFFLYRSNSVDSLASCCYSKDTRVLIRDMFGVHSVTFEEIEAMELKNGTYKIFNNGKWSSGKLVKLPNRQMYKVTLADGREMTVTDNHRNRVLGGMKLTKDLTTDDYQMVAFINDNELPDDVCIFEDGSYYYKIKSIEKVDYDDYVYCFEMDDKNDDMFTLANGIHNYNCRLRNELQDNTFSYTLGAGGVSTGSKCVITINFNRLIQDVVKDKDNVDWNELDRVIRQKVDDVHKYLIAYNEIVKDNLESGMLPIYDAGYISMSKQFLTIGINGLIEGAEYLGIDISPNEKYFDFCTACLKPIYEENKAAKTKDVMFNTEYVPAENLGVKNAKWDKKDGYFSPRDCYNSYFYRPEDETCSVVDKLILHGEKTTKWLDGGSAAHINLQEHLSKEQYKKLMEIAIKTGCSYFTFNVPNTICNDCGHISKHRFESCPSCGSNNIDYATRIIGYLKRVSSFSAERGKEESKRYYGTMS